MSILGNVCVEHCPLSLLQVSPTREGTYNCLYCLGIAEFTGSLFSWITTLSGNKFYEKRRNPESGIKDNVNRLGLNSILVRVFLRNRTNRSTDVNRQKDRKRNFIIRYWLINCRCFGESKLWLEIRKDLQFKFKGSQVGDSGRTDDIVQVWRPSATAFPSYLGEVSLLIYSNFLIRWCPPTLWREVCFTQSPTI